MVEFLRRTLLKSGELLWSSPDFSQNIMGWIECIGYENYNTYEYNITSSMLANEIVLQCPTNMSLSLVVNLMEHVFDLINFSCFFWVKRRPVASLGDCTALPIKGMVFKLTEVRT